MSGRRFCGVDNYGVVAAAIAASFLMQGCYLRHRVEEIEQSGITVAVGLPQSAAKETAPSAEVEESALVAYKDQISNEIVAYDKLNEIRVEATSANVAEREGKIEIAFEVEVPSLLMDSRWQLRLKPLLLLPATASAPADTLALDHIYITGKRFREQQLAGYDRYNSYLGSILPEDTSATGLFAYGRQFSSFMERHSGGNSLGADWESARNHYSKRWLIERNSRLIGQRSQMYGRFVKEPMTIVGVRRDTVVESGCNSVKYRFVEQLAAPVGRKRIELLLQGAIRGQGRDLCRIAPSGRVEYYISSLTSLAKRETKYKLQIIERNIADSGSLNILYSPASAVVESGLGRNAEELRKMVEKCARLAADSAICIDSVLILSSSSPEGAYRINSRLSQERADSLAAYLSAELPAEMPRALIRTRGMGEDWQGLFALVQQEKGLPVKEIVATSVISNPERREALLATKGYYQELKSHIYPKLRRSLFKWYAHRRGMVKDTLHTFIPDTIYMRGLEALLALNYDEAATLLAPYRDLNGAIALLCTKRNVEALELLLALPQSAERDYMVAIALSRRGESSAALEFYRSAVNLDKRMEFRGNLDPEIHLLTNKKY